MLQCRTEDFSGSNIRLAKEVIRFEIFELGNIDILQTLKNSILKETKFSYKFDLLINEIYDNGFIDDMFIDEQLDFCQSILNEINHILNKNIKYALWLANENIIKNYYKGKTIDYYETTNIILSNLGQEGILYGYEYFPTKKYSIKVN